MEVDDFGLAYVPEDPYDDLTTIDNNTGITVNEKEMFLAMQNKIWKDEHNREKQIEKDHKLALQIQNEMNNKSKSQIPKSNSRNAFEYSNSHSLSSSRSRSNSNSIPLSTNTSIDLDLRVFPETQYYPLPAPAPISEKKVPQNRLPPINHLSKTKKKQFPKNNSYDLLKRSFDSDSRESDLPPRSPMRSVSNSHSQKRIEPKIVPDINNHRLQHFMHRPTDDDIMGIDLPLQSNSFDLSEDESFRSQASPGIAVAEKSNLYLELLNSQLENTSALTTIEVLRSSSIDSFDNRSVSSRRTASFDIIDQFEHPSPVDFNYTNNPKDFENDFQHSNKNSAPHIIRPNASPITKNRSLKKSTSNYLKKSFQHHGMVRAEDFEPIEIHKSKDPIANHSFEDIPTLKSLSGISQRSLNQRSEEQRFNEQVLYTNASSSKDPPGDVWDDFVAPLSENSSLKDYLDPNPAMVATSFSNLAAPSVDGIDPRFNKWFYKSPPQNTEHIFRASSHDYQMSLSSKKLDFHNKSIKDNGPDINDSQKQFSESSSRSRRPSEISFRGKLNNSENVIDMQNDIQDMLEAELSFQEQKIKDNQLAIRNARDVYFQGLLQKLQPIHFSFKSTSQIGNQWENANLTVEEIYGGVAISVVLPYMYMIHLNIKPFLSPMEKFARQSKDLIAEGAKYLRRAANPLTWLPTNNSSAIEHKEDEDGNELRNPNSSSKSKKEAMNYGRSSDVVICINALRKTKSKDRSVNQLNGQYTAEIRVQGLPRDLPENCLSHRYNKHNGLLVVFLDRVKFKETQPTIISKALSLTSFYSYSRTHSSKLPDLPELRTLSRDQLSRSESKTFVSDNQVPRSRSNSSFRKSNSKRDYSDRSFIINDKLAPQEEHFEEFLKSSGNIS